MKRVVCRTILILGIVSSKLISARTIEYESKTDLNILSTSFGETMNSFLAVDESFLF